LQFPVFSSYDQVYAIAPVTGVVECGKVAVGNTSKPPEMKNFDDALRRVPRVSKDKLKEQFAKENAANADKLKRGPKRRLP
jgi:hypothetical protein